MGATSMAEARRLHLTHLLGNAVRRQKRGFKLAALLTRPSAIPLLPPTNHPALHNVGNTCVFTAERDSYPIPRNPSRNRNRNRNPWAGVAARQKGRDLADLRDSEGRDLRPR